MNQPPTMLAVCCMQCFQTLMRWQGEVLQEAVDAFRANLTAAKQQSRLLELEVARFFARSSNGTSTAGAPADGDPFGRHLARLLLAANLAVYVVPLCCAMTYSYCFCRLWHSPCSRLVAGPCTSCSCDLLLCQQGGVFYVVCSGGPLCTVRTYFPAALSDASVSARQCDSCAHGVVR